MFRNIASLAFLSLLWQVAPVTGAPSGDLITRQSSPGLPSQDPFYQPPSGFASQPLGTILRSRSLPKLVASMGLQGAYQLLYSSQDDVGRRGGIVTTILIPKNANFTKHFAYHAPYDSADPDCSPSYPLSIGTPPQGLDAQAINGALQQGIPVSTPDYEGPDAAFTAGPQSAYGTLDSMKAVLASKNITGILPTAKTVMFGYSGGSIAVEWASEFHATYAPNVKIVAAALGGLVVNIDKAFQANVATSSPGIEFAQLNGLASSYPDFGTWLDNALNSSKKSAFYQAKSTCDLGSVYNNQNLYSYFTNGSATFTQKTYTDLINQAGIMGKHGVPKDFPLWVYKGTADEVVPPIADTDNLVSGYCSNGATIKYFRYVGGTHGSTNTALTPNALAFLFSAINGTAIAAGCTTQNVNSS